jgi:general secretion pathway protein F
MPQFTYKAKKSLKEVISGVITAESEQAAINKILQTGQTPIEIKLQKGDVDEEVLSPAKSPIKKVTEKSLRVPLALVAVFTRQVFDMLDAGVPLLRCLEVLLHQNQHPNMQKVIESLHGFVQAGGSFSSALAQHPQVFPMLYINMVKSGESSGHLSEVLNRLAEFLEKDLEMRSKVKGSLLYPAIIMLVGMLTMFVLLTFVLPRLTVMFEDFDAVMPLPTQIVIGLSGFFASFWWLIILVTVGGYYYTTKWMKTSAGRRYVDTLILRVPLLSSFIKNVELARFSRTMGTLLESGVAIPSALESVTAIVENVVFKDEMKKITQNVRSGGSLTQSIKGNIFFSEIAVNLIAVGEESGKLEKGLFKLASTSERYTQETAQTFVTILGPAVLVIVVSIVGFIIVSMLLPMFRMNMIIN